MKEYVFQALAVAAARAGARISRESPDLVFVEKNGKRFSVYGNIWPLNAASAFHLASDKALAYACLAKQGIPAVEQMKVTASDPNPWDTARKFFDRAGGRAVVKDNAGTNGTNIFFCDTWSEFQKSLMYLYERSQNVNCSQRMDVVNEYRAIVLDGSVEILYKKERPYVIGDGKSPLISLVAASQYTLVKLKEELKQRLNDIPGEKERIVLSDQDNLSLGAAPVTLEATEGLFASLKKIAIAAASALGLRFCAVDIILDTGGKLSVLEVNPGIMFDSFFTFSEANKKEVVRIYAQAFEKLFGTP